MEEAARTRSAALEGHITGDRIVGEAHSPTEVVDASAVASAELVDNVESRTTSVPPLSMLPPEPLTIEVPAVLPDRVL